MWGVGEVDVERGRGLGGFEGKRTGPSTSPPRRRREREEDGGVGRDVRATQQELAPEPRGAGTALGLSVLLSQSRVPGVAAVPSGDSRNRRPYTRAERDAQHDFTYKRALPGPGMWRMPTVMGSLT